MGDGSGEDEMKPNQFDEALTLMKRLSDLPGVELDLTFKLHLELDEAKYPESAEEATALLDLIREVSDEQLDG